MGRRGLYILLIALALPGAVFAQGRWWGEYSLHGDYDRLGSETLWMFEQQLDGRYSFPVLDYTVGTVEVEGGIFQASGSRWGHSGSAAGLGRYGLTVNLFPYRKFPLTIYYTRESRPEFLDLPSWSTTRMGARVTWTPRLLGKVTLDYQLATTDWNHSKRDLTTWRIEQVRTFGPHALGSLHYESVQEEEFGQSRKQEQGLYALQLTLPREATILTRTYFNRNRYGALADRQITQMIYYNQPFRMKWRLLAWGSLEDARGDFWKTGGHSISATVYRDVSRWRTFAGASWGSRTYQAEGAASQDTSQQQTFAGITWRPTPLWALTADAAVGSETTTGDTFGKPGNRPTLTLHLGASRNADLPSWASSLAFAFREISFDRRMYEAFPPGYVPPELEGVRRRYFTTNRSGVSTLEADFYHHEENGDYKSDQLTVTGRIKFNHTLHMTSQVLWHKYSGPLSGEGELKSLYVSGEFHSPRGYSAGIFASYAQAGAPSNLQTGGRGYFSETTYSLGASYGVNLFGHIPLTAVASLRKMAVGGNEYSFRLIGTFHYGYLDLRWVYEYYQPYSGLGSHSLRVDLLRLFRGNAF